MPEARQGERARLSRRAVLTEAIMLADSEGFDALNMRTLASRLNVVPMALYKHISDRADLIAGMVEEVIRGYETPPTGASEWRERVRFRILAARRAYLAHPWLGAAIESQTRRTEAVFAHMNAIAGEFLNGGVSPDLTHYGMHALGNRIWGYSHEAFPDEAAPAPADADQAEIFAHMTQNFPHIVTIATDAAERNSAGCDQHDEFDFALDLLLDGSERLREAGWHSR